MAKDISLLLGSLFPFLGSTLPGPSASEVKTVWRYKNTVVVVIVIIIIIKASNSCLGNQPAS